MKKNAHATKKLVVKALTLRQLRHVETAQLGQVAGGGEEIYTPYISANAVAGEAC